MAVGSAEELRRALEDAAPDRLIGTFESSWIDFKGQPYALDTNRGTWELCKDVAAFANAGGGCIVVGIATEKPDGNATERASEIRPTPVAMANRERHRDIVVAGVHPVLDGFEVTTHPVSADKVLLALWIPAQNESARPFLVRYLLDDAGKRVHGFGWPVRVDDSVDWQNCELFQARLSVGALIESALSRRDTRVPRVTGGDERYTRLIEALDDSGPPLVLRMVPDEPVDLTSRMFGANGIAAEVRQRKPLRQRGFHLIPHFSTDVRGSNGVEWGSRWRIAIDMDGVAMMASRVNDMALGWNMEKRGAMLINAITLAEVTHDFYRLFNEVVLPESGLGIGCWSADVIALEMKSTNARLSPGWSEYFVDDVETATTDNYRRSFKPSGNPDTDTYNALALFYALFRLGPDAIPFCRGRAFDPLEFVESTRR